MIRLLSVNVPVDKPAGGNALDCCSQPVGDVVDL
jgi:hypothetical protein